MTPEEFKATFHDSKYLTQHQFETLAELNRQISIDLDIGRDLLIRLLEKRECFSLYEPMLTSLIEKTGLYPYIEEGCIGSIAEQIAYEFHRPLGLDDIVLHAEQMGVYQKLLAGENVILSAPTSFGKSLLIDAMIATQKFDKIVIIVPTIALIDETRLRLTDKFSNSYKIITHATQAPTDKVVYVLTQERFLEFESDFVPDFFVVDEFYKLSSGSYDTRTVSLNSTFLKLCRSSAQFLLIGPNIQNVNSGESNVRYSFFRTDFKTVATDIISIPSSGNLTDDCLAVTKELFEPTLIFCKSSNSAYKLASEMIASGISYKSQKTLELASWLRINFHKDWIIADFIEHGIGVHHSALPRSVSHYLLKLFNDDAIRFLLCTSTIIEGVNTSAKNIIIYDNKIANRKFDLFTFNNIKGRAGRMFKHFVGKVFLLNPPPEDELPWVDIPVLSLPEDLPVTLAFDVPEHNLSDFTKEQLRLLHAQDFLDLGVIKKHVSIPPLNQVAVAKEITDHISIYAPLLDWHDFPTAPQLQTACRLIFDILLAQGRCDDISSASQLNFKIRQLQYEMPNGLSALIDAELSNKEYCKNPTEAVEKTLTFLRQWGEFNFPRLLSALNDIQHYVLQKGNFETGEYLPYIEKVKQWFLPPASTMLEEYGIPFQITLKIEKQIHLGDSPDEILETLKNIDMATLELAPIEKSLLSEAITHL